jgi:hypothetical protein
VRALPNQERPVGGARAVELRVRPLALDRRRSASSVSILAGNRGFSQATPKAIREIVSRRMAPKTSPKPRNGGHVPISRLAQVEARVDIILSTLEHLSHQCAVNLRRCGELQRELDLLKTQSRAKVHDQGS